MKEIKLTRGLFAQVDDEDFEYLNQRKWHANKYKNTFYALTHIWIEGCDHKIYMHRLIMKPTNGLQVDHKDRNGLNNQKNNLRLVTQTQSNYNKIGHGKSKYLGVSLRHNGKFTARIKLDNEYKSLGSFNSEIDAAKKYDQFAKAHHGEFANLNFKPYEFSCPICGSEWLKCDLELLDSIGCPGCRRKFDLEDYMNEDEPLWHNWCEKCYYRMKQEFEKHSAI